MNLEKECDISFEEPWQAQVFAITVFLNESGYFFWEDWVQAFSKTLKMREVYSDLDKSDDYFIAWLETLEKFLIKFNLCDSIDLEKCRKAWEKAYLETPHGQTVSIGYPKGKVSKI